MIAWASKREATRITERNGAVTNIPDRVQRFHACVNDENASMERRSPIIIGSWVGRLRKSKQWAYLSAEPYCAAATLWADLLGVELWGTG